MRVAAIDLGTNTFILLVAEVESGRIHKVLHDEVRIVRVGQGVGETRRFHPEALARADDCLRDFSATVRSYGVENVLACATSAARDVVNGKELVDIAVRHGIPIRIISGDAEADFTFRGTASAGLSGPISIIDVGGGSTEYVFGDTSGILSRVSLDIGAVRLTEKFISRHPIPSGDLDALARHVSAEIAGAIVIRPKECVGQKVIAVAGTPTTLATLDQGMPFETDRVHGYRLKTDRVFDWVERLARMSVDERRGLAGMEPKRADVIVAGAMILGHSARALGATELEVSVRGLRYGIALEIGG